MKRKLTVGDAVFNTLNYLFFGLFTLLCAFPFYYILINSISSNDLVAAGKVLFFPRGIHFTNYISAFMMKNMPSAVLVSVSRTVLGTVLVIIAATFPGYALSKPEFWQKKFWYRFIVSTMYFNAGIVPIYVMYKTIGLAPNNYLVYLLPAMATPFNLILCKTYIESIPSSLEESAQIDGAGYLTVFIRIIFPLIKPIIATIAVFAAVQHWNSFMDTVMYISKTKLFTMQYTLYLYLSEANRLADLMRDNQEMMGEMNSASLLTPTSVRITITMITVLPILCVYPFFQKYFLKGIMIGAVKG